MLNWLDRYFSDVRSYIGGLVSDAVHWAIRGVMAVILFVFSLVGNAWNLLVFYGHQFFIYLDRWTSSVIQFAQYVIRVWGPAIWHYAEYLVGQLWAYARAVESWAGSWFSFLYNLAYSLVNDVYRWVVSNVYDPLKSYADQIWNDLVTWGYTAWWWITHPQALADALLDNLVLSLEARAWDIAGRLGQFAAALVVRNLRVFLQLVEDIITGVL